MGRPVGDAVRNKPGTLLPGHGPLRQSRARATGHRSRRFRHGQAQPGQVELPRRLTVLISSVRFGHARLLVASMGVVAAAAILGLCRGFTFHYDEWSFILDAPGWGWASYLQPHNEHPSILFKMVYSALLTTVGLRSYI